MSNETTTDLVNLAMLELFNSIFSPAMAKRFKDGFERLRAHEPETMELFNAILSHVVIHAENHRLMIARLSDHIRDCEYSKAKTAAITQLAEIDFKNERLPLILDYIINGNARNPLVNPSTQVFRGADENGMFGSGDNGNVIKLINKTLVEAYDKDKADPNGVRTDTGPNVRFRTNEPTNEPRSLKLQQLIDKHQVIIKPELPK